MKRFLICIAVLFFGVSIVIPIFTHNGFQDYVVTATTMLSGLCTLVTLIVAILLYDRYGIESKAKETTLKAVEETIAEYNAPKISDSKLNKKKV